ncbi:MAG: ABC transporter ATP-binding protein [Planctomycetota bacterium]
MAQETLIDAQAVAKTYTLGRLEAQALRGVTLQVTAGEFLTIVGPSGSGKTTLLNLIGALDTPTAGTLNVFGRDLAKLSKSRRADLRLHEMGFVFQAYNLVPVLTARENVEFVLELQGLGRERSTRAREILDRLGLADFADRRPNELSGGQQQRVAVARAVASHPKLVLADEPTANLDGENAERLVEMMRQLNRDEGITFVFSTHDARVVRHARRIVRLEDGRIVSDERPNGAGDRGAASSAGGEATP